MFCSSAHSKFMIHYIQQGHAEKKIFLVPLPPEELGIVLGTHKIEAGRIEICTEISTDTELVRKRRFIFFH